MNTISVDVYLQDGCGRCDHYRTPECKVHLWTEPLRVLRELLLGSDLVEEVKWGVPCYTLGGKPVVMLTALKGYCALSFFKGAALVDDDGLLERPGPNSQLARLLKFRSLAEVVAHREHALGFVEQAITLEREGVTIARDPLPEPMPEELAQRLAADPELEQAFAALTPGRQRSHILYVRGAKQSATRLRRTKRCVPKIVAGKGFHER